MSAILFLGGMILVSVAAGLYVVNKRFYVSWWHYLTIVMLLVWIGFGTLLTFDFAIERVSSGTWIAAVFFGVIAMLVAYSLYNSISRRKRTSD
ncbi:hypothetical protein JP09_007405 [Dehalogenimonas etheniformans]|uniref:Uncharacterized protein n=1 Tax=Dehalogenimonas etheniformans TaxID=1536648 RepID=A0A2P5P5K2_9CHLR|nr:hypothetical protein JP09_007405 [Dehalogenimonas etheniformans]